jgi:hypothetical protein
MAVSTWTSAEKKSPKLRKDLIGQHLLTCGDGSMIEETKTAQDATKEESRRWLTF